MGIEVYFIGVALIATWFALKSGKKAVSKAYRVRTAAWAKEHPKANAAERGAAALGNMLAMTFFGPPAFIRGAKTGWKGGWDRGLEWAGRKPKTQPAEPEATEPAIPASMQQRRQAPSPDQTEAKPDNVVRMHPRQGPTAAAQGFKDRGDGDRGSTNPAHAWWDPKNSHMFEPQQRSATVPMILTATGGEVTSPETLKAEADTLVEEAAAELQDAANDEARKQQEMAVVQTMIATSGKQALPQEDINLIKLMEAPIQRQLDAARARKAAATTQLSQAQGVQSMATKHLQLQGQGAAGEFYGNSRTA